MTCLRQAAEPGFKLEVTPNLALFFALHDARDASDLLKVTGSTVTRTQAPGLPIQGLLVTPWWLPLEDLQKRSQPLLDQIGLGQLSYGKVLIIWVCLCPSA